jgi:hypothetical protein
VCYNVLCTLDELTIVLFANVQRTCRQLVDLSALFLLYWSSYDCP